ncbi:N-acetylmuramoyl-L-alanine amidase [Aliarcobacter faecis]|uniref:N-acetylmuramoyl-L-alanine amidase n=1 Tax=Aliarcobacter faecis TaxID=1564138 RepID=UPI0004BA7EA0|nr:N-acetylmuramoyl-L-alanine amidase [Aliarcobacter faecis]QKF73850.1 N-acetylmuramoyl-L-alanine amidase [Aliarcobacter faecis]
MRTKLKYFLPLLFINNLFGFDLLIDTGHTPKKNGATSSTCIKEYEYNKSLTYSILDILKDENSLNITLSSKNESQEISFEQRYESSKNKDLFFSIHHDSVQEQFIKYNEKPCPQTDYAKGFSIFVSKKNVDFEKSLIYAKIFAQELINSGLTPSLHHNENIKGENRELVDEKLGIYYFDNLKVLRNANSPAILFEAGVIVNPEDEKFVQTKEFKNIVANALKRLKD